MNKEILRDKFNEQFIKILKDNIGDSCQICGLYYFDIFDLPSEENKGIPLYYLIKYKNIYITHNGTFKQEYKILNDPYLDKYLNNFNFAIYPVSKNEIDDNVNTEELVNYLSNLGISIQDLVNKYLSPVI